MTDSENFQVLKALLHIWNKQVEIFVFKYKVMYYGFFLNQYFYLYGFFL